MGTSSSSMTEPELKLLQTLVYQECGMYLRRAPRSLPARPPAAPSEGLPPGLVLQLLPAAHQPRGQDELAALLENLTVNETSFFRNKPQLDLFQKMILEEFLHRKQERRDWSLAHLERRMLHRPGAYTLAMLMCDALAYYYLRNPLPFDMPLPKPLIPPPWKVEILASDINYSVLRAAQEGIYSEHHMEPVDYIYRLRYFDKVGDTYAIKKSRQGTRPLRLS